MAAVNIVEVKVLEPRSAFTAPCASVIPNQCVCCVSAMPDCMARTTVHPCAARTIIAVLAMALTLILIR